MTEHEQLIQRLAARAGIASVYENAAGTAFQTSGETKRAILAGLGLPNDNLAAARESLQRLDDLLNASLPPVVVVTPDAPIEIPLRPATNAAPLEWRLEAEDASIVEGRTGLDPAGRVVCKLAPLAMGYYRLSLGLAPHASHAHVIVAPPRCWQPDWLASPTRAWGIAAQVYGLRTERDFGIGDFSSVAEAARGAGRVGASFLGLSPLHALFTSDRRKISPYSPSSRLSLETIFIDPRAVSGFSGSPAASLLDEPSFAAQASALRQGRLVEYPAVWELKRQLLERLWQDGSGRSEGLAFTAFRRRRGEPLELHATFEALSEYFVALGLAGSAHWPHAFRDVHSADVQRFRQDNAARISFHAWLQYLADTQFEAGAQAAQYAGMEIGLYRDLAVGADCDGSEVWANPERFAPGLSIGAPPDALSPAGQDWGLPPFHPLVLQSQGLAAFRDLVAANMRHAGAIRIDHAFQLRRLFLIPRDMPSSLGTYVEYPLEAMLAVLSIESHRARCAVIGEDLGNPPKGFSEAILRAGMLGYRVIPFERKADGAFKSPETYARETLAVMTTHDLPTLAGWWRGLDIDLRESFGVYDGQAAAQERELRQEECRQFVRALQHEHLASSSPDDTVPAEAAFRFLARSRSVLAGLQFEDVIGEMNQANIPGLAEGPPNWRRRLDLPVAAIVACGGPLAKAGALFAEEGRGPRARMSRLASAPPRATYRLQFHKSFTFDDAAAILPYLASLGVSHVYASPIEAAAPGSAHGYDVIDHSRFNPELGGQEGFDRFAAALRRNSLKLILDIVPNHMGIADSANLWWQSVLEWGELSPHAQTFDIDWQRPGAGRKLFLPVLAEPYGASLEQGALQLVFDVTNGSFSVHYHKQRFPICPFDYDQILEAATILLDRDDAGRLIECQQAIRALPGLAAAGGTEDARAGGERLKHGIAGLAQHSAKVAKAISKAVDQVNGQVGLSGSFDRLHRLLEGQAYRLAHWRNATSELNYRRFFDVDTLAGIRPEEPRVFAAIHELVFRLVDAGLVQGLRVDHIDGLADPKQYLQRLQSRLGPGFYILVEKIFSEDEKLRSWPIAGSTGYDALNTLDRLFVASEAESSFDRLYRDTIGEVVAYATALRDAKLEVLRNSFGSEFENLVIDLATIAKLRRGTRDHSAEAIRRAIAELIAALPAYRSYIAADGPSPEDRRLVEGAIAAAKEANALLDPAVFDFIRDILLGDAGDDLDQRLIERFRRRFQQLTGAIMAKGLEDTLFYRYHRFVALNEVGGDPSRFGKSLAEFHAANRRRAAEHPHSMIASATHDTKRGEDMRARLLALSTMPDQWERALGRWTNFVDRPAAAIGVPDTGDQYLLLQTILGAWPLELLDDASPDALSSFARRLKEYMRKALREAKQHSIWTAPNEPYEEATSALIGQLIAPGSAFIEAYRPLAQRLALQGMLVGLVRTILKCTLPGIPDIYQGTEFWDLSLVDPDNRRPVDYLLRQNFLESNRTLHENAIAWRDGRIKQLFIKRLLVDRATAPALYAFGDYRPIESGAAGPPLVAFERRHEESRLLVAALRHPGATKEVAVFPLPAQAFDGLALAVPLGHWRNLMTGRTFESDGRFSAADTFDGMPAIVLRSLDDGERNSRR